MPPKTLITHLYASPSDPGDHQTLEFAEEDVAFLAWTSITYLAVSTNHTFDDFSMYAMDIDRLGQGGSLHTPSPQIGFFGYPEDESLKKGAYSWSGTSARGRLRVFGPDLEAGGYLCAMPLDHIGKNVKVKRYLLRVFPGQETETAVFHFGKESSVLAWTGISLIDPAAAFNEGHGAAIDITHFNDNKTDPCVNGGMLGDYGDDNNVYVGAWTGMTSTLSIRLRSFGDELVVAAYACAMYYN